ncbi:MAG: exopolysaccharide biosynthesis polyprenyl glycosylphosphotransferase [Deltaproteobacteria bacterium]|nr:exopolysaccharide biosynthesis polyprenyl glycosylphosphotransferase [Deltaproteobacteria bacterium]
MKRYRLLLFLFICDAILIPSGLVASSWLRSTLPYGVNGALPIASTQLPWFMYLLAILCWVASFSFTHVYSAQHALRWFNEIYNVFLGSILATIVFAGITYFTFREFSRLQFIYFWFVMFLLLVAYRMLLRFFYRIFKIHRPGMRSRVLIVGAGELGEKIGRVILNYSRWGFDLIGYLDDDPAKQDLRIHDVPVRGTIDQISEIVAKNNIGEVWVTLPMRAYARLDDVVKKLDTLAVKIYIVPDYATHALVRSRAEVFDGMPVIGLRECVISDGALIIKRIFDITITSLVMIPLLPILGLIALAIKLDSRGPVFFRQERAGENGTLFKMLKFRTMVVDAEARQEEVNEILPDGTIIHKHANDPRVTRVGRFLRRYSLDELPQFFNVLRGEMSLVGPRPEMPWLVDKYEHWQRRRFAVPQGLTGWWQINARSDKPMHLNTEDDLYYVYNYSLWLDIKILLRTPWAALRGRGAF